MRTDELDYCLPEERIALHPTDARDGARLLVVRGDDFEDAFVRDWAIRIPVGSLVVVNDTRVRRARLLGQRRGSGGRVELLLLDRRSPSADGDGAERWSALARPLRALKAGGWVDVQGMAVQLGERLEDGCVEVLLHPEAGSTVERDIERFGHVPIPPYLRREDEPDDAVRYQTVFAEREGSVAAPTAGLHLTREALSLLSSRGVIVGHTTLHVGLGTFRPVTAEDLDEHPMHTERFEVSAELARQIAETRARGARVFAVGTTVVRSLESASDPAKRGHVLAQTSETRLLIQPGYQFRVVDGLLTNFHQPRSTLLSLVAAAVGLPRMKAAYAAALARGFRFLSYGDAMWIPEFYS